MGFVGREIGNFFVGTMFLTRLPVPQGLSHVEGRLARAARYFPLIGVLVGLLSGGVFALSALVLPSGVAAGLALAAGLLITGALHEDGLADTCDGLGGGATRERALEIMRDSRIGTYGGCALVFSIGLRWTALSGLSPEQGLLTLVVAHGLSRATMTLVLVSGSYARTRGLASSVAGGVQGWEAALSLVFAMGIALVLGVTAGLAAGAAALIASGLTLMVLIRRLGGYTGDGLGAIQQMAEIAVICTLAGIFA